MSEKPVTVKSNLLSALNELRPLGKSVQVARVELAIKGVLARLEDRRPAAREGAQDDFVIQCVLKSRDGDNVFGDFSRKKIKLLKYLIVPLEDMLDKTEVHKFIQSAKDIIKSTPPEGDFKSQGEVKDFLEVRDRHPLPTGGVVPFVKPEIPKEPRNR